MKNKKNTPYELYIIIGLAIFYIFYTLNKNKMSKDKHPKKQSTVEKVIFGLLIGGAVGSVLGLSVAPDKGKKTRKNIKKTGDSAITKSKQFLNEHEDAVSLVTNTSKGIASKLIEKFTKKENKASNILDWLNEMNDIPTETEEELSQ